MSLLVSHKVHFIASCGTNKSILSDSGAKPSNFMPAKGGGPKTFEARLTMWWHIWPNLENIKYNNKSIL